MTQICDIKIDCRSDKQHVLRDRQKSRQLSNVIYWHSIRYTNASQFDAILGSSWLQAGLASVRFTVERIRTRAQG